jgi:hypothetical protein
MTKKQEDDRGAKRPQDRADAVRSAFGRGMAGKANGVQGKIKGGKTCPGCNQPLTQCRCGEN